ncbi:MAG: T9SS type A sorting domain-containing protein [Chlorobi bacterium]|nr:T9SS type A sorting domain-containing protein [Chlorobiota bacterium]
MKTITNLFFTLVLFWSGVIFAQFTNVQINDPASTSPEEVTIAINTANPQRLAGGANIAYSYRSTDGGITWSESVMSSSLGVWGDPSVIYDGLGNLYFAHLSNPSSGGYWIDRIVVQKSTDNGLTWSDGAGVGFSSPKNQDKEWLAVDLTGSAYDGNIYMTWTEFDNYGSSNSSDSSRILFSRSTDQGETWSVPVIVSDVSGDCIDSDNTTEGAVPAVGPNGEIYVSWAGPLGLMFDKSTDGGLTFGTDVFVSDIPGGWDYNVSGISRANGLPITACDASASPYGGNIYVNWSDQRNGTSDTDIFLAKSTDGGATWSAPKRVNNDFGNRQQFFTWMDVDQTNGFVYFVFYDRRNTTGNMTDVYVARSVDGCETFQNFKVNEVTFDTESGIFFGDYIDIAAHNGKVYPIWTKMDAPDLSVWTALIDDASLPVELISFFADRINNGIELFWKTVSETNNKGFEVERKKAKGESIWESVGFVEGAATSTETKSYSFSDENISGGKYKYRLKQIDFDGSFKYSEEIAVDLTLPGKFELEQNYPNPFGAASRSGNLQTTIGYSVPSIQLILSKESGDAERGQTIAGASGGPVNVSLKVYDVLGREIAALVDAAKPAGHYEINFNAGNLPSGIYFYRMKAGEFTDSRKMLLLK